jgi:hypothetical protein
MVQHALSSSAEVRSERVHAEFGQQEEEIQSRHREHNPGCNHFTAILFLGSVSVFAIDELADGTFQSRCSSKWS